ncbi:MAG: sulfatase [Longimicrobiales bacterium]
MTDSSGGARRVLSTGIATAGAAAMLFAVLADVIRSSASRGFGLFQWILLITGLALFLGGMWLTPQGRARVISTAKTVFGPNLRLRSIEVILLALLFGIVTGVGETLVLFAEKLFAGRMLRMGDELFWVLPVMDSMVLAAIGLAFVLAGLLVPAVRSVMVVGFVFSLLCLDALLSRFTLAQRMNGLAFAILMIGLAVVVTRRLVERRPAGYPWLRRAVATGAAAVLLLGLAGPALRGIQERRALGGLVEAAADAPNILFVIWDTVRAKSVSLYGYERPTTERLEQFASTGMTFDFAISTASWTLPSHGSMFTGRYPDKLNATWLEPMDQTYPTLAEVLSDHGWATAGFSANLAYVTREAGMARGFAHFEDYHITPGRMVFVAHMALRNLVRLGIMKDRQTAIIGLKRASMITGQVLDWLEGRPQDRPFFIFANYMDAHDPYDAPGRFKEMYGPEPTSFQSRWIGFRESDPKRIQPQIDGYDACITYLDDQLGQLLDTMGARGLLENTIIVVAADHGEHFGDNGFMRHGATLYLPVIHVPLVIRAPGTPSGIRIPDEVTLRDLPATILDLAGVRGDDRLEGTSLRWAWERDPATPGLLFSEVRQGVRHPQGLPNSNGDVHSLLGGGYHYIDRTDNGGEELYNYVRDRAEGENLIESRDALVVLDSMRHAMRRHLSTSTRSLSDAGR